MATRIELEELSSSLAGTLERIASNPSLTTHLHAVLGTYCHQVRNQLNSLKLSLYFAKRSDKDLSKTDWNALNDLYIELEQWLDRLQLICRPLQIQAFSLPFELLIDERIARWANSAEQRNGSISVERSETPLKLPFDPTLLGRGLDSLVEWRTKTAPEESTFQITWKREGDDFVLNWNETSAVSKPEPSGRLMPEAIDLSREGLTLPMLHRIASLHGGRVQDGSTDAGWGVSIHLPIEAPAC